VPIPFPSRGEREEVRTHDTVVNTCFTYRVWDGRQFVHETLATRKSAEPVSSCTVNVCVPKTTLAVYLFGRSTSISTFLHGSPETATEADEDERTEGIHRNSLSSQNCIPASGGRVSECLLAEDLWWIYRRVSRNAG
jgi:hypothetical protein